LRHHALPLAATGYFVGVAVPTSPAQWDPVGLAVVTLLYGALAYALVAALRIAVRWGMVQGSLCGVAAVGLALWHFREQVGFPEMSHSLIVPAIGLGVAAALLLRRRRARGRAPVDLRTLAVATGVLIVVATAGFQLSEATRWRLLRYNRVLGTPAYFALGNPVFDVREALYRHFRESLPARLPADGDSRAASDETRRPGGDLALIVVDTLRADSLAAWGGDPTWMPETNDTARRSLVLRNVMANASWTRTSVASLFTGLLPEEHGALDQDDALAESHVTLAERMSERGYETRAFVTNWAVIGKRGGFAQGFDLFEELRDPPYPRAAYVVEQVERSLARDACSPCFVYVHLFDPHRPYRSGGPRSVSPTARLRGSYEAELGYLDGQLTRLTGVLQRHLGSELRILLTADHGEEFREHLDLGHAHSLYDEVLHVPAFVHGSGIDAGVDETPLELRDVFDLLQDPAPRQDADLRGWIAARRRESRYASIYVSTTLPWHRPYRVWVASRRVERGAHALIWSAYGDTWELYDRHADPGMTRNIIGRRPQLRAELEEMMRAAPRAWSGVTPEETTGERDDRLRALGYVE
jgi:arylsulfatase A-like enzyme